MPNVYDFIFVFLWFIAIVIFIAIAAAIGHFCLWLGNIIQRWFEV
jgi:hypothetical protein